MPNTSRPAGRGPRTSYAPGATHLPTCCACGSRPPSARLPSAPPAPWCELPCVRMPSARLPALRGRGVRMRRKCAMRRCPVRLALQRLRCRARPGPRRLRWLALPGLVCLRRRAPRRRLAPLRWAQWHTCASRLRQPDRDRLLRRPRAVFAFPDVVDLLADELAGGRRRATALTQLLLGSMYGAPLWHNATVCRTHAQTATFGLPDEVILSSRSPRASLDAACPAMTGALIGERDGRCVRHRTSGDEDPGCWTATTGVC